MLARAVPVDLPAPRLSLATPPPGVVALLIDGHDHDLPGVSLPRSEMHLVVRLGPNIPGGLDVHAMGARESTHRKVVRRGQRAITARLPLGTPEAVLGASAAALVGRTIALADLWGDGSVRQLCDRLAAARSSAEAVRVVEQVLAERGASTASLARSTRLALDAAERLAHGTVGEVASHLGVSERHLRRVFRDALGVGPKAFARVARFRRALDAGLGRLHPSWAEIALAMGYYDQAHLIAEFRAIAGVTPQRLVGEMRTGVALG